MNDNMIFKSFKGELLVFLSAIGFATMGVLGKMAYRYGFNTVTLLFFRFLIASIILFGSAVIIKKSLKLTKKELLIVFIFGFCGYNLISFCYFYSLNFIPASLTVVLFYTYPIFVSIFSFLIFKEKLTINKILSLILGMIGILFIVSPGKTKVDYRGVIFSLSGGVIYAFYVLGLSLEQVKKIDSIKMSYYTNVFASLGMGLAAFISGTFVYRFDIRALGYTALIGIFASAIAMLALFAGVKIIGAIKSSIIANFEVVGAFIFGVIFLSEKMGFNQIVGTILIILSAIIVSIPSYNVINFQFRKQ